MGDVFAFRAFRRHAEVVLYAFGDHIFTVWYLYLPHLYAAPGSQLLLRLRGMQYYPTVMTVVNDLLYVNFDRGLVNQLPVWSLEGGHISGALIEHRDRHDGRRKSLILSGLVAGAIALAALSERDFRTAVMFGAFAIGSLQAMKGRAIPAYRRYRE